MAPAPPPENTVASKAAERQRAALDKATHKGAVAAVQSAEVQQQAAPKASGAATGSASAPQRGSSPAAPTAEASASATASGESKPGSATTSAETADRPKPQPRYDAESFEAWALNNPDKAAELGERVFKVGADWKTQFIKHQGKLRKLRNLENEGKATLEQQRKAIEEGQALIAKQIEEQNGLVQPVLDLVGIGQASAKTIKERLEAASGKFEAADFSAVDFGAVDDLFEHVFGVPYDHYARARARQGLKVSPHDRAMRLENERLRRENERLKAGTNTTEAPAAAPAAAAPATTAAAPAKKDTRWMSDELGDHPVTEVNDWQGKIQAILDEHVDPEDPDSYTIELEEVAEQVLAASRERIAPKAATPAPRGKPGKRTPPASQTHQRPAARTRAPEAEDDDKPPKDFAARTQWAIERAKRRAGAA